MENKPRLYGVCYTGPFKRPKAKKQEPVILNALRSEKFQEIKQIKIPSVLQLNDQPVEVIEYYGKKIKLFENF